MIRALLAAFCFFVGAASGATLADPRLAKADVCGRFEIFHINGIMTDRQEAEQNLRAITTLYGNAYKQHLIVYALAYNQTRSISTDLYQSALQVISGYAGATWDKFMNAVTFGIYSPFMSKATAKAIATEVTDLFAFTRPSPYQDQDLADILNDVTRQTTTTARKVFIPHSQGNLYMNLVYDALIAAGWPQQSIGVVGVAVPYSSVRSGNTFITSANDVVIDATRLPTLNHILKPNVTIPYDPFVDVLGHNLIDTYLADSNVQTLLKQRITNEFGRLQTTAPDPLGKLHVSSWGMVCGPLDAITHPLPCNMDIPFGSPYQWWGNVSVIFSATTTAPVHAIGTVADLELMNSEKIKGCYDWLVSDRKNVIKTGNYAYHLLGQCGAGYPWQTPYADPDAAWIIYSSDGSRTTTRSNALGGPYNDFNSDVDMFPVCKRT